MNAYSRFDAQDKAIKAKVLELMKNCSGYIKRTGKLSNDEWNAEQMKRGEIRYAIASCERKLKTLYEREQTEDVLESIEWYEKARCQYKESEIMMNLGLYKTIEPMNKDINSRKECRRALIYGENKAMKFFNDDHKYKGLIGFDALNAYRDAYSRSDCSSKWKQNYLKGLDNVLEMWTAFAKDEANHQSNDGSVEPFKKHYDAVKNKVKEYIMVRRSVRH